MLSEELDPFVELDLAKVSGWVGTCSRVSDAVLPFRVIPARQAFVVEVWYFAEIVVPWKEDSVKLLLIPNWSAQTPALSEFISAACS